MTEHEWLVSTSSWEMFHAPLKHVSARKWWFLIVAGFRQWWLQPRYWNENPSQNANALQALELRAEGIAWPELNAKGRELLSNLKEQAIAFSEYDHVVLIHEAIDARNESPNVAFLARETFENTWRYRKGREEVRVEGADLMREVIGNPFRSLALNPDWLTPAVKSLAGTIYKERCYAEMSILGDALEDAGCEDVAILEHCRNGGQHVRGCWVMDLILGR